MSTLTPQPLTLEPQTPQEEPRPKTARDVLLDAARFLEEHGWGGTCAWVAMSKVSGGNWPLCGKASAILASRLPGSGDPVRRIWDWNDTPGRTGAEVIAAMRAAAGPPPRSVLDVVRDFLRSL